MTPRAEALLAMLDRMPGDHRCLYGLGMECMGEDAYADAADWLRRAAEADPEDVYTWYHLARALHGSGDAHAALEAIDRGDDAARRATDAKGAGELAALRESIAS